MIDQEVLQDSTEYYLKSLISEACGVLKPELDVSAPFGELGIDSFYVLTIIRRLEADFGRLPKTLLFEHFTIRDLAGYFVGKHGQTLRAKFANTIPDVNHRIAADHLPKGPNGSGKTQTSVAPEAEPVRILETEAHKQPEWNKLVESLFDRYKTEGSVSRGTRKIAPNLFIGRSRQGYFHYGHSENILLVYAYTGPEGYAPILLKEIFQYCVESNLQLNVIADKEIPPIEGVSFSATPFGVIQRVSNLKEFGLEGGAKRHLRQNVSKFTKAGKCRTEEYQSGSDPKVDRDIARIIDKWCQTKTMVNPLIHDVKDEILTGNLGPGHRIFLTYLDETLQNVILITGMSAEANGYLMDLEFYPPDMPTGGLEYAIVRIIATLADEGCNLLSLGGTYGCKLDAAGNADPEIDKILDGLRARDIFNDQGNFQFKNKFRPSTEPIFLCRPVGGGDPDNVIDIIMMIADPAKNQTREERGSASSALGGLVNTEAKSLQPDRLAIETNEEDVAAGDQRSRILSEFGFNPLNIPEQQVEVDLKTDSWAQLHRPFVETHMRFLYGQLQHPVNVDESVKTVFPFEHVVLTASGQVSESLFFKAWPTKGVALQNLLFPSTLFHLIDNGFLPKELPSPSVFDLGSEEMYKGNIGWELLQAEIASARDPISLVCVEVSNNAAGGQPMAMSHLRNLKGLLARHSIPLVMDCTRVMENAQLLIENEQECSARSLWDVAREILSQADAVIGSLTKDFCVNKGGVIATSDRALFERIQRVVCGQGAGIDPIDRRAIAISLRNRKQIQAKVLGRIKAVRHIWRVLAERNVPVVYPAGGHCILIDVKQIPEFCNFAYPVASFLAWMYLNTGIRASAHSVGKQKNTSINDLVRLAIPVGMTRRELDVVAERLVQLFERKVNIPELVPRRAEAQSSGNVFANYQLVSYHEASTGQGVCDPAVSKEMQEAQAGRSAVPEPPRVLASNSPSTSPGTPGTDDPSRREVDARAPGVGGTRCQAKDIAIIGMAGRYPKARDMVQLWENLTLGRDCIEDLPEDRYHWRLRHGPTQRYRAGFIDDVDRFDSLFFNISPREAEMLDPQERLFLEVAWEAIEDAGYYPEILAQDDGKQNIGVYVGAVWAMYQMFGVEERLGDNRITPNSFLWSIANRVSYWMNLSGPSLTLDTACSSSLTAIYLACEAIRSGECSAAIVGGANLDLHQAKLDICLAGGALSSDGVCRSFGKGANGYVPGEGVGALFLKSLDRAIEDKDQIHGVIKSAVVNHGGHTSGYTVPSPQAQAELIVSALEKAGIDARSIGYIEAHGTGTELGDPIEVAGLSDAFARYNVAERACALGSIKSNIGHLEAAAGIVGVSKVLLQMKHSQLVPSLHSSELNEFIEFEKSSFYVVQALEEWKGRTVDGAQMPLRAGISSFGAGGANAHLILEKYESPERVTREPVERVPLVFPLSARAESELLRAAAQLAQFLLRCDDELSDVAYTLQVGRKAFAHRLAVVAVTKEDLLEKLNSFVRGKPAAKVVTGITKDERSVSRLLNQAERKEFNRLLAQRRDPERLANLWTEGLLEDWRSVQTESHGRRVSLPTYPFADRRHWACDRDLAPTSPQSTSVMHPMIDTNESTFERQLFKKSFHSRDFFIYDHRVANIPTLPGVAYLELARKAGEVAAGRKVHKIRNVVWVSPIAVQGAIPRDAFIELKPNGPSVRFEVFSTSNGTTLLHCQGTLLYGPAEAATEVPDHVDIEAVMARCVTVTDGKNAYPIFRSLGLDLGPSFQVLQKVYKSDHEILGTLQLPDFRHGDLRDMVLHPSLIDGSLQAGMAAQIGDNVEEMFVPFSIEEVELLHPLQPKCFSYITAAIERDTARGQPSRTVKSNISILDESGRVLVRLRESTGIPLREVEKRSGQTADEEVFAPLFYAYDWEKAPLAVESLTRDIPGSILIFGTDERLRDAYQERLRASEAKVTAVSLVLPGENFEDLGSGTYKINPYVQGDFIRLFEVLVREKGRLEGICFAWSLDHSGAKPAIDYCLGRGVYAFLYACQGLIRHKLESTVQLMYMQAGNGAVARSYDEAMSGFIKTLQVEHPRLECKAIEVRAEALEARQVIDALCRELQAHTQDGPAVRYEGTERLVRRLKTVDLEDSEDPSLFPGVAPREKGVYFITGGAGGLGLLFARFLAQRFKARLVLAGRSRLSTQRAAMLDQLREFGAEVLYLAADISSSAGVHQAVAATKAHFGQINGIIHAAGVLQDSFVRNKTTEEMDAVLAPKVYGTLYLDEATKNEELDFFVTFSSLAALTGNAGQCDYSFANAFMDSFAADRERLRRKGERRGKALSINWSLWADGGMKVDEQIEKYFRKTLGIRPLAEQTGIDAFLKGLLSKRSQFAVLEGVQEKVEVAWDLRKKDTRPAPAEERDTPQAYPQRGEGELVGWMQDELSGIAMDLLKLTADDIVPDQILLDLGFDSIGLTTFANAINDRYKLEISPVLFFDYPSIVEIAKYLCVQHASELTRVRDGQQLNGPISRIPEIATNRVLDNHESGGLQISKGWNPETQDQTAGRNGSGVGHFRENRFVDTPIAIIGMSGVMPQSGNLEEFWKNLTDSKDMITVIPDDRWRWQDFYGDPLREVNKSNSKWGGFMREIDKFDPLFFGISPREAQTMDPQQRIFLETVWGAIEDSGHRVSDLSGTKTGLFVGVATNEYIDVMKGCDVPLDAYTASGNSHSVLANRVSFLLNLHGPSAPIDTACSSSLIALHRAIESIHTGSCEMAIVGGVQVMLSPAGYISFSMAGMLSGDGKCKTFDKGADGYVRGEGCGAILIKPLSAAEQDRDHIYAVIRATAENHGGRVTTLTAPNSGAQSELLIEAYEKARIDPATVGYIECHGTGTKLGDPIEIQALSKAFSELYKRQNMVPAASPHCALGSVKTNIGHLETAAGIASLLKVLLAMKHRHIPANINFQEMNPYISLKGTPFFIADRLTPWVSATREDGKRLPRRAGISSFGFGGANAHVVLEEYNPPGQRPTEVTPGTQLVVLSAKNEDRVTDYLRLIYEYLEHTNVDLADLAYTLQVGRDEMPERLALVVSSTGELKQKIQSILRGEAPGDFYRGNTRKRNAKLAGSESLQKEALAGDLFERKDLAGFAKLWVVGETGSARSFNSSKTANRISLPTYPFARQRYWIPEPELQTVQTQQPFSSIPTAGDEIKANAPHQNGTAGVGRSVVPPEIKAGLQTLVPVWTSASTDAARRLDVPRTSKVLLLGGDESQLDWSRGSYPNSQLLGLTARVSAEVLEEKLGKCSFDQLLWIAPDLDLGMRRDGAVHGSIGSMIEQQEAGVIAIFRITKALLRLGYAKKQLQWTVITGLTGQVTESDKVRPAYASIVGLIGSLAKENPQWDLRLLDVDSLTSMSAQECLSLPWDKQGHVLAYRRGEWLRQGMALTTLQPVGAPKYRQNGVYVVIGGAGGLGEVWSRFMIEQYQANIVWIGRRTADAALQAKIRSLTRSGRTPLYVSADATRRDALEEAFAIIRKTHPVIHGVVHAAVESSVVVRDQSLARIEEETFRASLAAKVDVSVNMADVFGKEDLDFMLFFSSVMSFFRSPGQSSYAAGSVFQDTFARMLGRQSAYLIKTMNWGYWGSVGFAADEFHRTLMTQMGIGSIEPREAMDALQAMVDSALPQMALMKTLNSQATAGLLLSEESSRPGRERSVAPQWTELNAGGETASRAEKAPHRFSGSALLPEETKSAHIQQIIIEKLSEVLRIDADSIRSDVAFAAYGVDSIVGVTIVRTISETLGIDLPLKALFECTTVAELADVIALANEIEISSIQPVDRASMERLPLSFSQERVWFFEQLEPGGAGYNAPIAVTISAEIDIDEMDRAFNLIIARHEILRTVFPSQDGQAWQLIHDRLDFKLERLDLSHYQQQEDRDRKAREICQGDVAVPFDLARGPLIRGKVIKLASNEHILMLNMHHIITDGWSLGVLLKELGIIMEACGEGRSPELPPLPIQYVDYSVWQRAWLQNGDILEQQLAHWKDKLAELPERLALSTDYPRPSVRNLAGAAHTFTLDVQLTAQLKSLAEQQGGTLFMILLAALNALLYRYTGQSDICVGTLIANRQHAGTEGLIGMFVNSLALRNQVEAEDTFSSLLSQVRLTCLEAYDHQETPFEKVVDMLHPQRSTEISPIFQVMTILQNATMAAMDPRFPQYVFENDMSEFDLTAEFTEIPEGLAAKMEYSTALFKQQTIERMAGHFQAFCRAVVADPTSRIGDLEFIDNAEKHTLLVGYNNTRTDYPIDKCIHRLYADQVLRAPDQTAAVFGDQTMTYLQLYRKSSDLALFLQSLGIKPDSVVGLCLTNPFDILVGILGALQAGGAYLLMDPACPEERLASMLQDGQVAAVLTQEGLSYKIRPLLPAGTKVMCLDQSWPEIASLVTAFDASATALRHDVTSSNLCYVTHSSGVTGRPRCVVIEHRALLNQLNWMQQRFLLTQQDVVLQQTPYDTNLSVWDYCWPLMAGASIVFADPEQSCNVRYLEALIRQSNITTLHFAPSTLGLFVATAESACASVRWILCNGREVDRSIVDGYKSRFPNATLHMLWRPTEAAVDVTAYDCSRLEYPVIPAGSPINNTQIYILDRNDHLQPIGVPGELYVAGDVLAREFLNRPELTRERFISNPFTPGSRMYKTGEIARWLDDGNIQILSRNGS